MEIKPLLRTIAFCLGVSLASPSGAVLIDSGDGTGNTTAPADDPGWDSVGVVGGADGWTAVHLGDGWVLSANHVSILPVEFLGVEYEAVPGTLTRLDNGDGTFPDLKIWGVYPHPPLPTLTIRSSTSKPIGEVVMIGNGRDRGAATDSTDPACWVPPPVSPNPPYTGFLRLVTKTKRWGTNKITADWTPDPNDTVSWYAIFDKNGFNRTPHEAHSVEGDSGGAVFFKNGGTWELMGIMHTAASIPGDMPGAGQQVVCTLFGNASIIADLSFYRDQILELTAEPVPEPGGALMLASGIAFLASVGRNRIRP